MASALDLLIAIKATDNASSELKKVQGAISGLGDAAVNVGKVLATGLAAGAAAVAAGLGASANAAAGFEQTMSGVKAVSGATADQMKQLSQKALELGKATVFSASEAGQGIEELVKGGVSIDDVMNGAAQATLNLASAGGVDLVTAATIASNALNGFNLKGADMAHISDVIAGAANASAIDVNEFGLAMAQSSAVASTVGLSFDDLAVAIAEMGNAGIKGADAGTSLKTMFLNLEPSTKRAANEMKALGIITDDEVNHFFDAEGHAKSLAEISGVLANATKDLTDEEKLQALQMLFGTDAVRAAAVMAKNGAEGFDTLAASMAKVSAEDVAKERLNNLKGDLEQLKGSVETAAISLGLALLPALREAAQGATDFVNGLIPLIEESGPAMVVMLKDAGTGIVTFAGQLRDNASGALQGIADKLADTGAAWAPWAAQAGPAGEAVGSALSGASGAVQALQMLLQGNFGGALAAARDSMKDFAAAADSLRAMFDQLIPQVDRDEIWNNLKDAVKLAGDAFALLWPEIQKTAGETGTTAESAGSLSGSLKDLSAGVKDVAATFGPIIETAIRVGTALDAVSDASTKAGISLHNTTVDRVISDFQQLEAVSHTLGQAQIDLHNTIVEAWSTMTAAIGSAMSAIGTAVGDGFSALGTAVQSNLTAMQGFFSKIGAAFSQLGTQAQSGVDAVGAAFSSVGSAIQAGISGIGAFFSELGTTTQGTIAAVGDAFSSLGTFVQVALDAVGSTVGGFFSSIGTVVHDGLTAIDDFFRETWNRIPQDIRDDLALVASLLAQRVAEWLGVLQDGMFAIGEAIRGGWNAVLTIVGDALGRIVDEIVQEWGDMASTVGEFMNALGTVVHDGWEAITSTVGEAMSMLGTAVHAGWDALSSTVGASMSALGAAVQTGWDTILAAVGGAMSALGTAVHAGWDAISSVAGGAMSALGSAVQNGWTAITSTTNTSTGAMTSDIQTAWDTILAAAAAAWNGLSAAIGTALDAALTAVGTWVADILGKFTGLAGDMGRAGSEAGQALVDGLTGAITGGIKAVGDKAAEIARGTLSEAKKALGAESPSKEFAKLGVNIGEGLIQGIQSMKAETAAEMNAILKAAVSGIKSSGGGAFLTIPQFGSAIRSLGFNESTISAICGPIAAQGIAEGLGKSISLIDVEAISTKIGAYAKGAGTFGSGAFQKILSAIGIDSRSGSFQEAVDAAMKGIPVAISTPLHYFLAQGFDQATQQFVVGNTGTALKAGAEKMTRAAIEGVAGAATYIIPAVQAAGAAVRTLATDIATGFDSVATPAVFDLEAAITDLVGTNELWQQLDANASETGRDLATFLGDIAAPGVELVTSSLSELQAMSGLTLPQIQVQAEATGKDLRHWLLEVGVPSAVRLAEEFKALQDRAGPALEATGVSLRVLARDIEASFTSTAPTAIDKFFSLLEKLATDVDAAGDDIASKMEDIATKVASGIAKATEDGARQIADAMRSAQDQLDQLGGSLADPTSTTVKQSALGGEISAAKALHAQQRSDSDQLFFHQRDLTQENTRFAKDTAKAAIQLEKDLARAKSDVDRSGIVQKAADARAALNEAHKAQIDSLDTGFAQKVADNARSRALDAADRAFDLAEDAKMVKFRQAAIIAERDAKILAAKQATTDKLAEVQDLATKERKILAQSYVDKIADLKAGLLDKLPGLTGEAAVVVNGVFDQVATQAAGVTGTITGAVATASDAAQTLVATYGIKIEEANAIVNDHGAVVKRVLGVDVPGSMGLTDTAVENFADAFHVSWDTAREMLEATGKLSDAVMGKQIPGAAKDAAKVIDDSLGIKVPKSVGLTGTALDLAGVSAGNLKKPVNDATTAAKSFAKDGLDPAKDSVVALGGKMGEVATNQATQIAAVLLRLRDGLLGTGDYAGKGLIDAVKSLIATLAAIPTDIKVTITTNQTGGLMAGVAGAGPAEFAQSGISEGSNRNAPAGNVSPFPGHIGESGPGGKYNDPSTGKPYTRAVGGPVRGGVPVIVGEHRPELFTPQSSGWISSSVAGGGGAGIDYQRLGMELAKAMQNAPAPRVAVEDIRSSLVAVGMRNGGQVGLA